jgi:hypothetical protein
MKANIKMTESRARASSSGLAATSTKVNTETTSETVTEKCTGLTAAAIKESGSKGFNMDTAR